MYQLLFRMLLHRATVALLHRLLMGLTPSTLLHPGLPMYKALLSILLADLLPLVVEPLQTHRLDVNEDPQLLDMNLRARLVVNMAILLRGVICWPWLCLSNDMLEIGRMRRP